MDMTKIELMRIPFATVLFISSVFMLLNPVFSKESLLGTIGALLCIGMLVCSMVLFSNLDMPANKY